MIALYYVAISVVYTENDISNKLNQNMTMISDSQIVVALISALVTGILALRLGRELYR